MNTEKPAADRTSPIAAGVTVAAGILAMILRIVPHPPNFSAVGALGLFGGARLPAWKAYAYPLGVMVLSDLTLWVLTGFDFKYSLGHLSRVFVYASFMIYVFIGRCLLRQTTAGSVALAVTLGALQFFVVTNFCEWLFQPWQPYYYDIPAAFRYSRDWDGLVTCFAVALPFYQTESSIVAHPFMLFNDFRLSLGWLFVGDLVFTITFILVHAKLVQRLNRTQPAPMSTASA
jgi:hypothetical protein